MKKNTAGTKSVKNVLIDNIYLFSALIVISVFSVINPRFLSLYSIQNVTLEMAPLIPLALGIGFVLYTGGIDLSIGAVASATCVMTGMFVKDTGNLIILCMLLFGAAAGLLNGLLVTKVKLPSFIVTLCAMSVWRALAIILSGGGSANIPLKQRYLVNWASQKVLYFPVFFWISLVLVFLALAIERKTELGKSIFAVGANEKAARLTGVPTDRVKIIAFMLCSTLAALGGVMYAYKLKSSVPTIGDNKFMIAISAVALGGTLFSGGKGSALRSLVGVVTVITISSGMNLAGVNPLWNDVVYGLVLIFAVAINSDKSGWDVLIK